MWKRFQMPDHRKVGYLLLCGRSSPSIRNTAAGAWIALGIRRTRAPKFQGHIPAPLSNDGTPSQRRQPDPNGANLGNSQPPQENPGPTDQRGKIIPASTDRNPTSAVILKAIIGRIETALTHVSPSTISPRARHSVSGGPPGIRRSRPPKYEVANPVRHR
jgi:hypothetical protein